MAGGRPTKYDARYHVPWAEGMMRRGATVKELAESFDVSVATIYNWRDEHPEFLEALNIGREQTDMEVERSLYERAMGYTQKETRTVTKIVDGQPVPDRVETIERQVAPDTTACIFWLKNRNPKLWRDRQDIQVKESDDSKIKEWIEALGLRA